MDKSRVPQNYSKWTISAAQKVLLDHYRQMNLKPPPPLSGHRAFPLSPFPPLLSTNETLPCRVGP